MHLNEMEFGKKYKRKKWKDNNKYIIIFNLNNIDNLNIALGVPKHRSYSIRPFFLIKTKYDYEFAVFNPTFDEARSNDWEEL